MMQYKDAILKAADYIRAHTSADDFTINGGYNNELHARFAQNGITQHISGTKTWLSLSVAFGAQTGAAEVNELSEEAVKNLIKRAETMAHMNQPDPEFVASEQARDIPKTNNYSDATASLSLEDVVSGIQRCVANARGKDARVSGISQRFYGGHCIQTKNGFSGWDDHSTFSHSMTMKRDDVETKVSGSVKDFTTFDMTAMINRLNEQFDALSSPVQHHTGRMPVILRPAAVLDWLWYLMWMYQRRMADDGLSPYSGQIGNEFFGKRFTLRSSIDDAELSTPPFSDNAIVARNINWVNKGVIEEMRVDRDYAKLAGIPANYQANLIVDGGETSEAEMMKMVDNGIIVNRLWYIRSVDQKRGEMTGLTRDGVLYFEDGAVKRAVTNFRWNEIFYDMTRRILALGPSMLIENNARVPAMLIDGFNFVDVTTF